MRCTKRVPIATFAIVQILSNLVSIFPAAGDEQKPGERGLRSCEHPGTGPRTGAQQLLRLGVARPGADQRNAERSPACSPKKLVAGAS